MRLAERGDGLRGLYPAAPLFLAAVAGGLPQPVAELVHVEHHGVKASRAEPCQSSFRGI